MVKKLTVNTVTHPYYDERLFEWIKWRDTYEGGQRYIDRYLEQHSSRESNQRFIQRKAVTYNPAFAREAVDEIKNSIFQRLVDISRKGGSDTYNRAVVGKDGGIDLLGCSMNGFIGKRVLPELLVMSRIGVYVDMPEISGVTISDSLGKRPYVYAYNAEDIRSWCYDEDSNTSEFSNILLRDTYNSYDDETGLPTGIVSRYRRLWLQDGVVHCQYYTDSGAKTFKDGVEAEGVDSEIILDIPRIPFVLLELSHSLMTDIANYQKALLNLASADMAYALGANFPFYTEMYDPRMMSAHIRPVGGKTQGGEAADGEAAKNEEIKVGIATGRRYPKGFERPGFIHPSSEPLRASMEKQEQLKAEIRQLVNLAVSKLQPTKQASAESKAADNEGLESGLSYIGLELEHMERKVADFWDMYEGKGAATIHYPETYNIKTRSEKQAEAKTLADLKVKIPSKTYQKAIDKRVAELTVGKDVSFEELKKIKAEIDNAKGLSSDPEQIAKDVEIGLVDLDLASELRGYPKGSVKKAADDHAERLTRIAESQQSKNPAEAPGARGVPDLDGNPTGAGSEEKKTSLETLKDPVVKDKQRGPGKGSE